jgi:hypothetical protein
VPRFVIIITSSPALVASALAASAYAVSPVWVMRMIASSGPTMGAQTTKRIDETATADRPASWSIPAPRIAA